MIGFDPLTDDTRPVLEKLILLGGDGDHVEIGTLFGASAIYTAMVKRDNGLGGKVYCIDPFDWDLLTPTIRAKCEEPPSPELVIHNALEEEVADRIEIIRAKSDPFPLPMRIFATGYIDGDHTYEWVRRDWENLSMVVKRAILFDDARHTGDPFIVINEIAALYPEWEYEFFEEAGMCLATRK